MPASRVRLGRKPNARYSPSFAKPQADIGVVAASGVNSVSGNNLARIPTASRIVRRSPATLKTLWPVLSAL
jgi:hypothetical protein